MAKFKWTLQKLLDVTRHREQALRMTVAVLSKQIADLEREVVRSREMVKEGLAEMGKLELSQRLSRQETFMRCAASVEKAICLLKSHQAKIEEKRSGEMARLLKMRESRKSLERLREDALKRHGKMQSDLEQKQFDQTAHIAKARAILAGTGS